MHAAIAPLLAEFDAEAAATRRILERVPDASLTWRPHPKSFTLGQLAMHIAQTPSGVATIAAAGGIDVATFGNAAPQPAARAEILDAHARSVAAVVRICAGWTEVDLAEPFVIRNGATEIARMTRAQLLRSIMCNHLYHHRGQLTVYLRLLDVPVPGLYGSSADEGLG